jgi:hypothetical protein
LKVEKAVFKERNASVVSGKVKEMEYSLEPPERKEDLPIPCFYVFGFFFFAAMGFELWASCLLGRHSYCLRHYTSPHTLILAQWNCSGERSLH